jgi:hypothetical protein
MPSLVHCLSQVYKKDKNAGECMQMYPKLGLGTFQTQHCGRQ